MADEPQLEIMIDSAESKLPPMDETIKCPEHPLAAPEIGFGLAGGGYGVYTVCPICARILSKTQEEFD